MGNGPTNEVDPSGKFKSYVHKQITLKALAATRVNKDYWDAIVDINIATDFPPAGWNDPRWHAQVPEFVNWPMKPIMREIRSTSLSSNTADGTPPIDWMTRALGRALHVIQDFYTHTDWLDGKKLCPLYRYYGAFDLVRESRDHAPHFETLPITVFERGDVQRVKDLIYFGGGYDFWGGKISTHNKYAVDEAGFGRNDMRVPFTLQFSYTAAFNRALMASIEFLRWSETHMQNDIRRLFFGSIPYPDNPPKLPLA